jgi:anti-anti-sigma regulatory factor
MVDLLFDHLNTFQKGGQLEDDLTAVVVKASSPVAELTDKASVDAESVPDVVAHEEFQYFDADQQGDIALLRIREEEILSSQKCAAVKAELVGYIQSEQPTRVVISFRAVKRFSSEGINICFQTKSVLDAMNGQLRLCEMGSPLREAFKALNLDGTVFEIHDDLGTALNSF